MLGRKRVNSLARAELRPHATPTDFLIKVPPESFYPNSTSPSIAQLTRRILLYKKGSLTDAMASVTPRASGFWSESRMASSYFPEDEEDVEQQQTLLDEDDDLKDGGTPVRVLLTPCQTFADNRHSSTEP